MRNNIYQQLIENIAKRNWADAQDLFNAIIEQKVAVKLDEEKQLLQEPDEDEEEKPVKEAAVKNPCEDCGKETGSSSAIYCQKCRAARKAEDDKILGDKKKMAAVTKSLKAHGLTD